MDIQEALLSRRSVYPKQFNGAIIPEEVLDTALEAANWAPTHKRTQPWRFVVYHGDSMQALIDKWVHLAQLNVSLRGEEWTDTLQNKYDLMRNCSHILAIACHYTGLVPEVEETCATAAAVQNFWLSLQAQGYYGYWSTGNGIFTEEIHNYLGLSENEKALGYFLTGFTDGPVPPSVRKPVSELVRKRY